MNFKRSKVLFFYLFYEKYIFTLEIHRQKKVVNSRGCYYITMCRV